jgi:hypothetical protein
VHRNLLENFVPFFALGSLWLATSASQGFGTALFVAFTIARISRPFSTSHAWAACAPRPSRSASESS